MAKTADTAKDVDYLAARVASEASAVEALVASIRDMGLADDEELLTGMIEGETNLMDVIDRLIESIIFDEGTEVGIKAATDRLKERGERIARRKGAMRALIEQAMMIAELKKLPRPLATLTLSERKDAMVVEDESKIPSDYFVPADPKLDRKALREALDAGEKVPGASLVKQSPSLTMRVK